MKITVLLHGVGPVDLVVPDIAPVFVTQEHFQDGRADRWALKFGTVTLFDDLGAPPRIEGFEPLSYPPQWADPAGQWCRNWNVSRVLQERRVSGPEVAHAL